MFKKIKKEDVKIGDIVEWEGYSNKIFFKITDFKDKMMWGTKDTDTKEEAFKLYDETENLSFDDELIIAFWRYYKDNVTLKEIMS